MHVGHWISLQDRWLKFTRRTKRRLRIRDVRGNAVLTPPRRLPKTVWIYWDQGLDQAPPVVRECAASWSARNPGWTVRVLARADLPALIEVADVPSSLLIAHQTDVFRVRLLEKYGGVWADATLFAAKPLDDWLLPLMQSGFFAFASPAPDRLIDSWFLASEPNGLILRQWSARITDYVRTRKQADTYFWPLVLFRYEALRSRGFRNAWSETPKVSADGPLLLQRLFQRRLRPEDLDPGFDPAAIPVHKLSWKDGKLNTLDALRPWGLPR